MATPVGDERDFWERRAAAWERRVDGMEEFSAAYGLSAMDRLDVRPGERIADIGCGPGTTAIELARRVAPGGEVLGIDIAAGMVAAAERRAAAEGVSGVRFAVADIEASPIDDALDGIYSRFGVMFFRDPAAAFANLAASLRPGGRLGCVVWSILGDNPWMFVPTLAAVQVLGADLPLPGPGEPGPFSLADTDELSTLLTAAGFIDVTIDEIRHARVLHEATVKAEVRSMLEVGPLADVFGAADADMQLASVGAVIEAITPFADPAAGGWSLPSAALIVFARRPD